MQFSMILASVAAIAGFAAAGPAATSSCTTTFKSLEQLDGCTHFAATATSTNYLNCHGCKLTVEPYGGPGPECVSITSSPATKTTTVEACATSA